MNGWLLLLLHWSSLFVFCAILMMFSGNLYLNFLLNKQCQKQEKKLIFHKSFVCIVNVPFTGVKNGKKCGTK